MPVWNTRVWKRFAADNERKYLKKSLAWCEDKSLSLLLGKIRENLQSEAHLHSASWGNIISGWKNKIRQTLSMSASSCSLHPRLVCWRFLFSTPSAGVLEVPDLYTFGWRAGGPWSQHPRLVCWRFLISTPLARVLEGPVLYTLGWFARRTHPLFFQQVHITGCLNLLDSSSFNKPNLTLII